MSSITREIQSFFCRTASPCLVLWAFEVEYNGDPQKGLMIMVFSLIIAAFAVEANTRKEQSDE